MYRYVLLLLIISTVGCRPSNPKPTLIPDAPTRVPAQAQNAEVYSFGALPNDPTTLRIDVTPASLAYRAEVRDARGTLIATLGSVQNAHVTVPPGSGVYEVRVFTDETVADGEVELLVSAEESAAQPLSPARTTVAMPQEAGICRVAASNAAGATVTTAPSAQADSLGLLRDGATVQADARAPGWYRVRAGETVGWVAVDAVRTDGPCDTLAFVAVDGTFAQPTAMPLGVGGPQIAPNTCALSTVQPVTVRTSPGNTFASLGNLSPGGALAAVGRSPDGAWFAAEVYGQTGWLPAEAVTATGACAVLNVLNPAPTANSAPFDVDSYFIAFEPALGGVFEEQVSYPDGDRTDRITVSVEATTERTFTLRLTCEGPGAAGLHWGTPEQPTLGCGGALNAPFSTAIQQRSLLVTMPQGGVQGWVRYRLSATPSAQPDAEASLVSFDRDSGARHSDDVSAPEGDTLDTLVIRAANLEATPPHDFREVVLYMACTGGEDLRWGPPGEPRHGCGAVVPSVFSSEDTQQVIVVTLPEPGYTAYTLYVIPVAPTDAETYTFTVDRNAGGRFGEIVSAPAGDRADTVQLSAANLNATPPNNYREFHIVLRCEGAGAEHLRWGGPTNPNLTCGASLRLPVLAGGDPQPLVVTVPEGNAYISYTFIATPLLPEPTRVEGTG